MEVTLPRREARGGRDRPRGHADGGRAAGPRPAHAGHHLQRRCPPGRRGLAGQGAVRSGLRGRLQRLSDPVPPHDPRVRPEDPRPAEARRALPGAGDRPHAGGPLHGLPWSGLCRRYSRTSTSRTTPPRWSPAPRPTSWRRARPRLDPASGSGRSRGQGPDGEADGRTDHAPRGDGATGCGGRFGRDDRRLRAGGQPDGADLPRAGPNERRQGTRRARIPRTERGANACHHDGSPRPFRAAGALGRLRAA